MTGQGYPQLTPPNRPRSGPALTVNEPLTPTRTGVDRGAGDHGSTLVRGRRPAGARYNGAMISDNPTHPLAALLAEWSALPADPSGRRMLVRHAAWLVPNPHLSGAAAAAAEVYATAALQLLQVAARPADYGQLLDALRLLLRSKDAAVRAMLGAPLRPEV